MITYCDNAVKLIKRVPTDPKGLLKGEHVLIMIRHTCQILPVPVSHLEVQSGGETILFHGKDLELEKELQRLDKEEAEYVAWKKANG